MFVGSRLRAQRELFNEQPETLALALGRTAQTVHLWERGRVIPPTPIVEAIAKRYDVSIGHFFDDEPAEVRS